MGCREGWSLCPGARSPLAYALHFQRSLMEVPGPTPSSSSRISRVYPPMCYTCALLTLPTLGQGLTKPCKPETQPSARSLTGSRMLLTAHKNK